MCQLEGPRDETFCGHAILRDTPLVVPDAHRDARFAGLPMVLGEPYIRFYAGQPVRDPTGSRVGTICIADHEPREMSAAELVELKKFGRLIESELAKGMG